MAYEDMTVAELKEVLREQGLPVSGKKADLIARLNDSASETPPTEPAEEAPEAEEEQEEEFYEEEGDYEDWEDDFHTARQKPVLDASTKAALEMRASQSKKQPSFRRQEWFRYRRLSKTGYRKPKGKDSKMLMNRKYRSPMARVGYGKVASARGLHPSGFEEVLVHNIDELDGIDPERQAVRIVPAVGTRKRSRIHDRADDLGLRVLNRRPIERKGDIR